jgi:inhibitor of cysteine peptidase
MKNTKWFIFSFLATLLIISAIPASILLLSPEASGQTELSLNKFSSYDELKTFLETSPPQGSYQILGGRGGVLEDSNSFSIQGPPSPTAEAAASDYSKTNIQVEGVDEADIAKSDGEYLYIVAGNNLTIVKAYPPEDAAVVSKITLDGGISGILINGNKLAVFETDYSIYLLYDGVAVRESSSTAEEVDERGEENNGTTREEVAPEGGKTVTYEPPTTSVKVYDISDKANPVLTRDFVIDGNYFSSRMVGDYVYVVVTMYTYFTETDIALPRVQEEDDTEVIQATDIYYCDLSDSSYTFTTIAAININNDAEEPTHETIVLGGTSGIFVSQDNIYLAFPDYSYQEGETMKTAIQRIKIDGQSITIEASGEVPGYVLNQFSMDEHNGYFRVATTVYNWNLRTFAAEETTRNNVYVLDMNLNIVGKLEDLAPGEQIYSARFMGNRCYVVTFRNIDPLFVIDLTNPAAPAVLGELKVTGYSGYLHPYDENHIIGIGKETDYDATEDFAWYQGVKISLFDVSDVSNPVEIDKFEIGDRGTDSPSLYDHKSLLFDREKNLLVIPVAVAEIDEGDYPDGVPDWAYGEYVWQGAYVLDISLDGIDLRGRITHMEDGALAGGGYSYYYEYTNYVVNRALYMDDVLYTVSNMKVKMNNLQTLAEINEVELS